MSGLGRMKVALALLNVIPFFLYLFAFISPRTDVALKHSLVTFTNVNDPGKEVRLGPLRSCKRGGKGQHWVCDGTNIVPDYTRYLSDIVTNSSSVIPYVVRPVGIDVNTTMMVGWTMFLVYWLCSLILYRTEGLSRGPYFESQIAPAYLSFAVLGILINAATIIIYHVWLGKGARDFNALTIHYGLTHGLSAHVGSIFLLLYTAWGVHVATLIVWLFYMRFSPSQTQVPPNSTLSPRTLSPRPPLQNSPRHSPSQTQAPPSASPLVSGLNFSGLFSVSDSASDMYGSSPNSSLFWQNSPRHSPSQTQVLQNSPPSASSLVSGLNFSGMFGVSDWSDAPLTNSPLSWPRHSPSQQPRTVASSTSSKRFSEVE